MADQVIEFVDLADEVSCFLTTTDPRRPQLWKDPWDFFRRLREHDPVYRAPDGRWLLTSFDAASALHREDRWKREPDVAEEDMALAERVFRRAVTFRDPPEHTRLRQSVNTLFTKKAMAKRRERIADTARRLLDPYREQPEFDFRNGVAYDLPVVVIGEVMGLRPDDVSDFDAWSKTLIALDEHEHVGEMIETANRVASDALEFFDEIIEVRRSTPGDDVITWLLASEGTARGLTSEEISAMCIQLHLGGHTTTTDLLGNGLYHLLRKPDVYRSLHEDPSLIPRATEEMLRFDPPVSTALPRITPGPMMIGDKAIAEGEEVQAIVAAAGRDPKRWEAPDTFDILRKPLSHVAFGSGLHFCLGAHLARIETEELFRVLVTDFPELEPAADLDSLPWLPSYIHRGLTTLPVAWAT